jgi:hypothetical protein
VNVLPGSPECGDASACLKLRTPVIRRGCLLFDQFACPSSQGSLRPEIDDLLPLLPDTSSAERSRNA